MKFEKAFEKSLEYFNGDDLAASVFLTKYALTSPDGDILEETPDAMHRRLAKEFARIESKYPNPMSEEEIYNLLKNFKYIVPQGSPMAGIGNPYQTMSLSNCFVIESPWDSYGGILKTDQEEAQIMKRRGGVGFDISTIRPKGLTTNNAAKTTDGIAVFMERFSNTCREVAQGGRRGALMLTISVHHPEIRTFINVKRDLKKVTGANISVRLTDEFMNAVKNKTKFELRWPVDSKNPQVKELVDANELWTEIIESAHACAEPGLLFWDTILRRTPAHCYSEFVSTSTNPCQPGWATVLTPEGIRTFDQIDVGSKIWSGKRWTTVIKKQLTGVKTVYAYKTTAGVFYGTENHRVVSKGQKIEVKDAKFIDVSIGQLSEEQIEENVNSQDVVEGLTWGIWKLGALEKLFQNYEHEVNAAPATTNEEMWIGFMKNKYLSSGTNPKDLILPFQLDKSDSRKIRGFLKGLYSAIGDVVDNNITLNLTNSKLAEQIQLLLSSLGIQSYLEVFDNNDNCVLNITNDKAKKTFSKLIGFTHFIKQKKLKNIECCESSSMEASMKEVSAQIYDVRKVSEEHVYDITVDAPEHTYWSGGLLVSNCGELLLSPYDSCRLLLVNVTSFVENPFTDKAKFNYEKYAEVCQKAQRLMDDMIDLELECIDRILEKISNDSEPYDVKKIEIDLWTKIKDACYKGRRTGTGVTGIGDAIAGLNVVYGSEESIKLIETIYRELAVNAYRSTVQLAKERGPFPVYNYELEKDHEFIKQIMDLDSKLCEDWKKYGRRNIALTTTAPAGSVSILTQTTSGIEPAFLLHYKRRRKINPTDKDSVKVDFVDHMGDKWTEYDIYHHWFKKWMDITGKTDVKDSPYYGATSNDINWVNKVKAQAAAQKWVCHSISNTTNVPNDTSIDVVKDIYMTGWESGTKGVTVYRDGCRSGVLVSADHNSNNEQKQNEKENACVFKTYNAPKRPKELNCDIHFVTVNREKWTIFVGKLENKPYEIMGGLSKFVNIPKKVKSGKIVKYNGSEHVVARYDLHYDYEKGPEDEVIIKDITNIFDNATYAAFTRTISLALRHGTPVQYVVEQLQKGSEKEDDLFSFSRAMVRVLKNYIADGTKVTGDKVCPSCSSNDLIYQEGCATCKSCGYSKCT